MTDGRFLDGSPIPPGYIERLEAEVSAVARFMDELGPEGLDDLEREIEAERRGR